MGEFWSDPDDIPDLERWCLVCVAFDGIIYSSLFTKYGRQLNRKHIMLLLGHGKK